MLTKLQINCDCIESMTYMYSTFHTFLFPMIRGNYYNYSIEEGLRMQAMNRAQRVRVRKHETEPDLTKIETASTTSNDATPLKRSKTAEDSDGEQPVPDLPASDIELVFRPLPNENQNIDSLQTRFIKTTANATGNNTMFNKYIIHENHKKSNMKLSRLKK